MGRNNRQRRAAKQKNRTQRGPTPGRSRAAGDHRHDDPERFLSEFEDLFGSADDGPDDQLGSDRAPRRPAPRPPTGPTVGEQARKVLDQLRFWASTDLAATALSRLVAAELRKQSDDVLARLDAVASSELLQATGQLWERGWQLRELIHVAARLDKSAAALAAHVAVEQLHRSGRLDLAPDGWRSQLEEASDRAQPLAGRPWSDPAEWNVVDRLIGAGADPLAAWVSSVRLLVRLQTLPPLAKIVPPPSAWTATTTSPPRVSQPTTRSAPPPSSSRDRPGVDRDKVLTTIRALLAKAESTQFAAEAEALTAKAQAMMTRHAIDEALLHATTDDTVEVASRRVLIDNPYLVEKVHLLSAVGAANRTKVVWMEDLAMATIVGTPVDADQVEMLFVSLLIQATRAMAEAGAARAGTFDRSPRFRRSFLTAYAVRIGERLSEADAETTASYGTELVPVLRRQEEAVAAAYEELFPHTRPMSSRKTYDRRGWDAGREAADRATFVAGRIAG